MTKKTEIVVTICARCRRQHIADQLKLDGDSDKGWCPRCRDYTPIEGVTGEE